MFVGAGPGDPGLLTMRAVEALRDADVVILECEEQRVLLSHAPDDVEVLDGGHDDDGYPLTAAMSGRKTVGAAKGGRRVVRLLAGDPFTHATG
ncbi:MAG: bifunctional uroporphyrinogen-III C-methyltransferase/uroporphyrinogen-III synthase, partial [Actinobacteria bacterium]|nr:bifunctional uroporphyrinogen-III C-methyltransferase/uroporphyrinogen-III synthase [Actinomycetota bacterium]NIS34923.1 bifunctional uroporphyrinogen-III C-methyltransferase/uroporphyrinogen-III synthase [Actinomycetota bacterium]NIU69670.1 bifunctional uroporphyrinogen-III C-methyltransferase/uroporphyrinogen-III synthase [Actinomycetota bacterium]NIW31536.1 bifunctional uroporphyrinogen-III C-methyltransferase/uroporphyrinogen-III synthase [Actinomycetota bacterium]